MGHLKGLFCSQGNSRLRNEFDLAGFQGVTCRQGHPIVLLKKAAAPGRLSAAADRGPRQWPHIKASHTIPVILISCLSLVFAGCGAGGAGASFTSLSTATSGPPGSATSSGASKPSSANGGLNTNGSSNSTDTGTAGTGSNTANNGTVSPNPINGTTNSTGSDGALGANNPPPVTNPPVASNPPAMSNPPAVSNPPAPSNPSGSNTSGSNGNAEPQGTVIANIQTNPANWRSWGQVAPAFVDCSPSPCDGVSWSMKGGITSPSLSNNAMQFTLGGTTPYGDALFSPGLIGDNSKEIPDSDHSLLSTLHTFTYEVDFYVTNVATTQSLEFDLNMFFNGVGMIWGHQCNHLGDQQWDVWDNVNAKWVSAGVPCNFVKGWNHLTIHVQRKANNTLLYQSITLNGTTYTLNISYAPGTAPAGWWGMTANYQMDGDYKQTPNTTYLDNFNVTYQ